MTGAKFPISRLRHHASARMLEWARRYYLTRADFADFATVNFEDLGLLARASLPRLPVPATTATTALAMGTMAVAMGIATLRTTAVATGIVGMDGMGVVTLHTVAMGIVAMDGMAAVIGVLGDRDPSAKLQLKGGKCHE